MKTHKLQQTPSGGSDDRLVLALLEAVKALENPICYVWPADDDGEHVACFTPSANPKEMLVVVDANALLPILNAAIRGQNVKRMRHYQRGRKSHTGLRL